MEAENNFSLGSLDGEPEYERENYEQEEFYSEDEEADFEESDSEESFEDEEEFDFDDEEIEFSDIDEEEESDELSYEPFITPLLEEGYLYIDENKEYDDSPEGLNQVILDTVEHRMQEYLGSLPEDYQRILEVIQAGESLDSALGTFNSFDYESVDLDDVDTQKEITKDYYRQIHTTWSEQKLDKHVQNLEDLDELAEEANDAKDYFVAQSEYQKQAYYEAVREREYYQQMQVQQEIEEYNDYIDNASGFKGLEFSSNRQREEFRSYCFDKGSDGLTQYERETKADTETRLAQAFYTFNRFGFENIERKARTQAVVEQKKNLARFSKSDKNTSSNRVGSRKSSRPSNGFELGDL